MKLLTMKQVCEKTGCSRSQINRFRNDPNYNHLRFPRPVTIVFKVLFSDDEIEAWIEAQLDKR